MIFSFPAYFIKANLQFWYTKQRATRRKRKIMKSDENLNCFDSSLGSAVQKLFLLTSVILILITKQNFHSKIMTRHDATGRHRTANHHFILHLWSSFQLHRSFFLPSQLITDITTAPLINGRPKKHQLILRFVLEVGKLRKTHFPRHSLVC